MYQINVKVMAKHLYFGSFTLFMLCVHVCAQLFSLIQLFVSPMDCCLPVSSVHRILQTRILEWFIILFSKGFS